MFRDRNLALEEREKVELRDKLRLAENRLSKLTKEKEDELLKLNREADNAKLLLGVVGSIERFFTWPFRKLRDFGQAVSRTGPGVIVAGFMITLFVGMIGLIVYHEFYDIRDGYVVGRDYVPGHFDARAVSHCAPSGNDQVCSTTIEQVWVPPAWTLDIAYQHDSASWGVSEAEYDRYGNGDWYCARDLLHSDPCIPPIR